MRPLRIRAYTAVAAVVGVFVQSCNSGKVVSVALSASGSLHQRMNSQAFAEIYAESSPSLKKRNEKKDFVAFMDGLFSLTGSCRSAELRSRNVTFTPDGDTVELIFRRECEKGSILESVVWIVGGNRAVLDSFHYSPTASEGY